MHHTRLLGRIFLTGLLLLLSTGPFVIDNRASTQNRSSVACTPSGGCLVVYECWNASNYDIGGRLVKPLRVYLPLVRKD